MLGARFALDVCNGWVTEIVRDAIEETVTGRPDTISLRLWWAWQALGAHQSPELLCEELGGDAKTEFVHELSLHLRTAARWYTSELNAVVSDFTFPAYKKTILTLV
jgi:hypothetical protein